MPLRQAPRRRAITYFPSGDTDRPGLHLFVLEADGAVHRRMPATTATLISATNLDFSDEFVEHLPQESRVPAHDGGGCGDVAVGVEVLPVEDEAGIEGELLEEGTLSLLRGTPVTGSAYGSSGIYGRRYLETVLRYSSAALISPSTYADTSRSCSGLKAPGSSTCTDFAADRAASRRAR
jgi:hypothetical protein